MDIRKFSRAVAAGALSFMVAASSSYGAIAAFADDEYAVSQATLDAMAEDYYTIEPIDSEMLSFSDYYDIYSGENRPDTETVVSASSYSSASGGDFSVGSYGPEDDNRDEIGRASCRERV